MTNCPVYNCQYKIKAGYNADNAEYTTDENYYGYPYVKIEGTKDESETETIYDIWVGGIQITEENQDNITGSGISGQITYDPDGNTLTLKDVKINGNQCIFEDGNIWGLHVINNQSIPLTLKVVGNNAIEAGTDGFGILAEGDLTITGGGSLSVIGGDLNENYISYGILISNGDLTIEEGILSSTGGAGCGSYTSSCGIYVSSGNLYIRNKGKVIATGGNSSSSGTGIHLEGIGYDIGNLTVDGGSLEACGGDTSGDYTHSYGISVYDGGVINIKNKGEVTAKSGSSNQISCGVFYSETDDIGHLQVNNGSLVASGGNTTGSRSASYGINLQTANMTVSDEGSVVVTSGESNYEKRAFSKWASLYRQKASITYDPPLYIKLNTVISTGISLVGTIVLYYGAIKSGVSVADYFAFNVAYGMVSGAFLSLSGMVQMAANIKPVVEMVKPILETVPEVSTDKKVITRISGGIELTNVSFRYSDSMPLIVDNLSLKIRPGQYVAIVGKTGCGKSTLMRLLLGFEKPQKGAIYYDGKDISKIDLKSLRRHIGVVMQNSKLFSGDIFSNIVICAPWLTMKEAWEAAELAGIADDIRQMPMGMHTMISEGGGSISGGQKQRLLIARAVAGKPRILMFDEATSALDNITQKAVADSLAGLKCTRIVIAHRLSTIKECDRIIVLDGGRVIEDGSYQELIERNGYFAELVARQLLDEVEYVGKTTLY